MWEMTPTMSFASPIWKCGLPTMRAGVRFTVPPPQNLSAVPLFQHGKRRIIIRLMGDIVHQFGM
jgi:hypothetical protein